MPAARVLHAGLALLDRQLLDGNGQRCGKVDDLELAPLDDDRIDADHALAGRPLYVDAVLAGPGALLSRSGHTRLGAWLRAEVARVGGLDRADPVRIPIRSVADIGSHVTLSIDADEVATSAGERWVHDHVISHLPGSDDASPG